MAIDPKALVKFAFEMAKDVAKNLSDRLFGGREQPTYSPPPPPPPRPRPVPDREIREAYSDTESPVEAYSAPPEEPAAPEAAYAAPKVEKAAEQAPKAEKAPSKAEKAPKAEKPSEKAEKPPKKAEKAAEKAPKKAEKSAEKAAEKAEKAPKKAEKPAEKAPKKAPKKAAKAAEKPESGADGAWARYFDSLPAQSKRFVELLEERRQLTIDEAVEALGVSGPKAIGGLTGAMSRWAPKHGVELPFEARTDDEGKRLWVWTGA